MATLGTSDNDNEPWSEMEIADLLSGLGFGASIEEIAAFLMRDPEEVRQKVQDTLDIGSVPIDKPAVHAANKETRTIPRRY